MLRPQFQQNLKLAFLMLASALMILAEPAYARNSNKSNSRSERAASSAKQETRQSAPAPAPAPKAAPAPTPAPRASTAPRAIQQPTRVVQKPSQPAVRSITNNPSITTQQSSRQTQSRVITNNPVTSSQSRNVKTNQPSVQTQTRSNNFITNNSRISSRSNTTRQSADVPSITNQPVISPERENSLGFNIGTQNRNSSSFNSSRSNSIFNRQTTTNTNERVTRNNVTSNRNTQNTIPSIEASQPAASTRNRISSDISSQIGGTIGTKPESTTNVRGQENRRTRSRIVLPFDQTSGSSQTSSQTEVRQPADSSSNNINSDLSARIGNRIDNRSNSSRSSREQNSISTNRNKSIFDSVQNRNNVTPPSNSARQPADSLNGTSSLDRANTGLGIMIGPERTPPNNARQPAASLNDRNSHNGTNTNNRTGQRENPQTRTRRQNSVGSAGEQDSNPSDMIGQAQTDSSSEQIKQSRENTMAGIGTIRQRTERRADRSQTGQNTNSDNNVELRSSTNLSGNTRTTHVNPDNQGAAASETRINTLTSGRRDLRAHRYEPVQSPLVTYRDRPYDRDSHHNAYLFVDQSDRLYRRYISPRYSFSVRYNRGSWLTFGCVFPYYQRKYIFVSLDGFWPYNYTYMRYYWYGYHPYYWYGYYPIAREVGTDINYYTYNYYYNDDASADSQNLNSQYYGSITRQTPLQPSETTLADTYFEDAVNAFEKGNYNMAIEKFSNAMALAPNDMILPFAYSQALFAAGRYSDAAQVLRAALEKTKPDQDGVFYPRGLYPNEDILLSQIDKLANETDTYRFDADLQLLLGYQLLGLNDTDKAVVPLKNASLDLKNQKAADILLNLLAKIKTNDNTSEEEVPPVPEQETPKLIEPEQETVPVPATPLPEKVEPNKAMMNQPDTTNLNIGQITFADPPAQKMELAIENTDPKNVNENLAATENITGNEKTNQKAKEGILLAALFVLAGTTGLGHFIHH